VLEFSKQIRTDPNMAGFEAPITALQSPDAAQRISMKIDLTGGR
jgi:hypothetical protein